MEVQEEQKTEAAKSPAAVVNLEDFNKLKDMFESVQSAQKGADKKVTELEKLLRQKDSDLEEVKRKSELEKLSVEEQLKAEMDAIRNKLNEAERTTERERFIASGYKEATSRGLPTSLVDNYGGSQERLVEYLDSIKADREAAIAKIVNDKLTSGHEPKGGVESEPKWDHTKHTAQENEKHFREEWIKRNPNA